MNKFSWYEATSVEDALQHVNSTVSAALTKPANSAAVIKAGGIDLLDLMKEGLVEPKTIINIRNLPGLKEVSFDKKEGLKIGANVTLGELEDNSIVKEQYLALHQAVAQAGTPQLRNTATLGGNLAQRTRCWYFRSFEHKCFRKGGNMCFAKNGENEFHSIMKNGTCCSVHASSVATALLAFHAQVEITSADGKTRLLNLDEFFVLPGDDPSKENVLKENELITNVILPPVQKNTNSYYMKQGGRESYDWALADTAVVIEFTGSKCKSAIIALGAAAPVPLISESAAQALIDNEINEDTARKAAGIAMEGATPLAQNGYKVPLFKNIIKRTLLNLA